MEYKVYIKVFFPGLDLDFDVYIPTTRTVQYVALLLQKHIQEHYYTKYQINPNIIIFNKSTGAVYEHDKLIADTDIRNGDKIEFI